MPPPPDEPNKTVFDDESVRALAEQHRIRKGTVPDIELLAAHLRTAETWYFSDSRGARSWRVLGLPPSQIRDNMRALATRLHNAVGGLDTDEGKRLLAIMQLIHQSDSILSDSNRLRQFRGTTEDLRAALAALGDEESVPDATPERKILQWAADEAFKNTEAAEQHVSSLLASVNELARLLELASYTVEPGSPGEKTETAEFELRATLCKIYQDVFGKPVGLTFHKSRGGPNKGRGGPGIRFVAECLERMGLPKSHKTLYEWLKSRHKTLRGTTSRQAP